MGNRPVGILRNLSKIQVIKTNSKSDYNLLNDVNSYNKIKFGFKPRLRT